jgi:hypothetical protein
VYSQVPYDDVDKAEAEFRAGRVRGVLHFGSNFSSALHERHELGRETRDEVVDQGILNVSIDETSECPTSRFQSQRLLAFDSASCALLNSLIDWSNLYRFHIVFLSFNFVQETE